MLQYAGHKALVTILRVVTRLRLGPLPTTADEVIEIPSREAGRGVRCFVYRPSAPDAELHRDDDLCIPTTPVLPKPTPVLLNFHGSGFVIPLHGSDDLYCRLIAAHTPYTVPDLTYRLAPEHPFPAALEDAEDALRHVLARPELYDASRVAVSGFSAGGNLALVLASGAGGEVERGTVRKCVAFYPVVDLAADPGEKVPPEEGGFPIPAWMARTFDAAYSGARGVDRKDPRVSPLFAAPERFCGEVLVVTCGYDSLAVEGERLVEKLEGVEGVKVRGLRIGRVNHAWDKEPKMGTDEGEKRERAYMAAVEMLNGDGT